MIYLQRIYYDFLDGRKDMHLHEADFILNYICSEFKDTKKFIRTEELFDIRQYHPETFGNNIFVFDYRTFNKHDIVTLVKTIKPKIIFMLSDEGGSVDNQSWNETLAANCKLFIREYRHFAHSHIENTMYLPCGFSNYNLLTTDYGEFNPNWYHAHVSEKHPATERKIHWSFMGNFTRKKNLDVSSDTLDRQEIIKIMQELPRGLWGVTKDGNESIEIYKDSVFVINMRGWLGSPTSRPYDAMMTGAIPVVVCDPEEREIQFYGQSDAPWVWATDWVAAREECRRLLHNPEELLQRQRDVQSWWNNYLQNFRNKIRLAMTNTEL